MDDQFGQLGLVERFLKSLVDERHLSMHTFRAYESDLVQFRDYLKTRGSGDADSLITACDKDGIDGFIARLRSLNYSPSSIARKSGALHSFYKWLLKTGAVGSNPTAKLRSPKISRPVRTVSMEQITALLAMPDLSNLLGARDLALIEVMLATGAKVSELVVLDQEDLDTTGDVAYLNLKGPKARSMALSMGARAAVARYLGFIAHSIEFGPLFINKHGGRLSTRSVRRKLEKYLEMAGIEPGISPSSLRHTYAQGMVGSGADAGEVQKALGYNSKSTVVATYGGTS